jgi:hypothetical protein
MTNTNSTPTANFWGGDFFTPSPSQDSDLLKQIGFIPGLKELLMVRQVHALEHATVWVLGENLGRSALDPNQKADLPEIAGMSTENGFYLYGDLNYDQLRQAVSTALERLTQGEWHLAVHPRCGTNLSVTVLLTMGMIAGTSLIVPKNPLTQLVGMVLATATAFEIAPDLGNLVQKYITTGIPFNLEIVNITQSLDTWGNYANFVELRWCDLQ